MDRELFRKRLLTDKGIIANLQVLELDIANNEAIILQQHLIREEEMNVHIITELEVLGQLPPKLHDVTGKVKALEQEFRAQDNVLDLVKPPYLMDHPNLRHKKLALPGKRDMMEIPRDIRDIGLTPK